MFRKHFYKNAARCYSHLIFFYVTFPYFQIWNLAMGNYLGHEWYGNRQDGIDLHPINREILKYFQQKVKLVEYVLNAKGSIFKKRFIHCSFLSL